MGTSFLSNPQVAAQHKTMQERKGVLMVELYEIMKVDKDI